MVINAVCPHCKRVYPVDEQYAGQTFSCETCGNPFTVPTPGVVQPVAAVPAIAPDYFPGGAEISRNRKRASVILFVLSGLGYLGVGCIACAGVAVFAAPKALPPGAPAPILATVLIVFGLFGVLIATVYLICGIRIRKGGFVSAVVALVLASLHELLLLLGVVSVLVQGFLIGGRAAGPPGQVVFQLIFQVCFILAIGQLIYYLIKILREPRA
ncbi:MAG: hypothetical protein ACTHN5_09570 [Phycisphaerae bacterium]